MKISSNNNLNFKSRSPEIRKADDIQRRAKAQFPMMSSTYVYYFYRTAEKNYDGIYDKLDLLNEKITDLRSTAVINSKRNFPYVSHLNGVKDKKVGNCFEASMAAVSALLANGYTNSNRGKLMYVVDFIDKSTGKVVKTGKTLVDHNVAVTDMNMDGEKNIVLDPWFGFSDTKDSAISRYKMFYKHINTQKATAYAYCNAFKKLIVPNYKKIAKKYDIKSRLDIEEYKELDEAKIKNLASYSKTNYPNLVLKNG